jgi:hypothetical protein
LVVWLPYADCIQWCGKSGASRSWRVLKLPNTRLSLLCYALSFELTFM